MQLQTVAVFSSVGTVGAAILVHVGVRLHVTVQHGLVDTRVVAFRALEGFRAEVIAEMVFEVVLVLGDKRTLRALEHLVVLDMSSGMLPEVHLENNHIKFIKSGEK